MHVIHYRVLIILFFVRNEINIPQNLLNSYMFGSVLDKSETGTSTASTYSVLYFLWSRVVRLCSPCMFSEPLFPQSP